MSESESSEIFEPSEDEWQPGKDDCISVDEDSRDEKSRFKKQVRITEYFILIIACK